MKSKIENERNQLLMKKIFNKEDCKRLLQLETLNKYESNRCVETNTNCSKYPTHQCKKLGIDLLYTSKCAWAHDRDDCNLLSSCCKYKLSSSVIAAIIVSICVILLCVVVYFY